MRLKLWILVMIFLTIPILAMMVQSSPSPQTEAVPEHQIVYLINAANPPTHPYMTSARIQDQLGAQTATSWDQVLEADALDAIIIHHDALPLVDRQWISQAYWQDVVIAGFNMDGEQMAALVRNPCITASGSFGDYAPDDDYFIVVSGSLSGSSDDVERLISHYSQTCGEGGNPGVDGGTSAGFRSTTERLLDDHTFNIFVRVLNSHMTNQP